MTHTTGMVSREILEREKSTRHETPVVSER